MATTVRLTEPMIQEIASPQSFERGCDYFERGAVLELVRRGQELHARVAGSDDQPYRVRVRLTGRGIGDTECSCPYDWGGACKHVVAALLAYVHAEGLVQERPRLEALLADLDGEQVRSILVALARSRPDLTERIESLAAAFLVPAAEPASAAAPAEKKPEPPFAFPAQGLPLPASHPAAPRRALPDRLPSAATIRRRVCTALHSLERMKPSEAYWHVGEVLEEVRNALEPARMLLEVGEARRALTILQAVTEEYFAGWMELDGSNGEPAGFFGELGDLWEDALSDADLSAAEREQWAERIGAWRDELSDYDICDAFANAESAVLDEEEEAEGEETDEAE